MSAFRRWWSQRALAKALEELQVELARTGELDRESIALTQELIDTLGALVPIHPFSAGDPGRVPPNATGETTHTQGDAA